MPIVQIAGKLVYFAHVPKSAGTAVEQYLAARFGQMGFLDRSFLSIPKAQRWNRSSPQHMDANTLETLLPSTFFAAQFAVVRHPVRRIMSVFRFQRDIERKIARKVTFSDWLDQLEEHKQKHPFYIDNHARPMVDLVPRDATVFRIEDGTDPIIEWLDKLAGNQDEPRDIRHNNTYQQRLAVKKRKPGPEPEITPEITRKIAEYYAADFNRFGYTIEDVLE